MKLLGLTTENVRGVADRAYLFTERATGAPLDVALVTGFEGSGKTSLIEAVAAAKEATGSYGGPSDPKRLLRSGATRGRMEIFWWLSDAERKRSGLGDARQAVQWSFGVEGSRVEAEPKLRQLFATYSHDPEQGKLEYFPANRRLRSSGTRALPEAAEGRLRPTRDADKYAGLRRHLGALALADAGQLAELMELQGLAMRSQRPDALAPYKEAIARLLPDLRLTRVEPQERSALVHFQRRDGSTVELDALSDSEQQAVLFATTFRRLGLHHSLVLIDTPELHLHPRRHADFLAGLAALGRDNQLIAATTSPELLAAARAEQVIDLSKPRA